MPSHPTSSSANTPTIQHILDANARRIEQVEGDLHILSHDLQQLADNPQLEPRASKLIHALLKKTTTTQSQLREQLGKDLKKANDDYEKLLVWFNSTQPAAPNKKNKEAASPLRKAAPTKGKKPKEKKQKAKKRSASHTGHAATAASANENSTDKNQEQGTKQATEKKELSAPHTGHAATIAPTKHKEPKEKKQKAKKRSASHTGRAATAASANENSTDKNQGQGTKQATEKKELSASRADHAATIALTKHKEPKEKKQKAKKRSASHTGRAATAALTEAPEKQKQKKRRRRHTPMYVCFKQWNSSPQQSPPSLILSYPNATLPRIPAGQRPNQISEPRTNKQTSPPKQRIREQKREG